MGLCVTEECRDVRNERPIWNLTRYEMGDLAVIAWELTSLPVSIWGNVVSWTIRARLCLCGPDNGSRITITPFRTRTRILSP